MPRYWRLVGFDTPSGALALGEAAIYDDGTLLTPSAVSSTLAVSTGSLTSLSDGLATPAVTWTDCDVPGFAITYDLGSGYTDTIDTAFNKVSLHLTDSVVDRSYYATGPTGPIVDSSAESPFGGRSLKFDYSPLKYPARDEYALPGDYTIEFRFRHDNFSTGQAGVFNLGDYSTGMLIRVRNNLVEIYVMNSSLAGESYSFSVDTWYHLALSRTAGVVKLFIDGTLINSWANTSEIPALPITLGASAHGSGEALIGKMTDIRIVKGEGLYTTSFTPAELTLPPVSVRPRFRLGGVTDAAFPRRFNIESSNDTVTWKSYARFNNLTYPGDGVMNAAPATGVYYTMPESTVIATRVSKRWPIGLSHITRVPTGPVVMSLTKLIHRDMEDGGVGRIFGTVKEKHTPSNTPLRRKVVLLLERENRPIRTTWSDAVTGAFEFRDVKMGVRYVTISYDHTHNYRAVIADNQLPELQT